MRYIKDRNELGKEMADPMNRIVVIVCKSEKDKNDECIDGGKIRVFTGKYFEDTNIRIYREEYLGDNHAHVNIGAGVTVLTADYGIYKVVDMANRANMTKVSKDDDIIFVLTNEEQTYGCVIKTKVAVVRPHCMTSLDLEDGASEEIAKAAWAIADRKEVEDGIRCAR